MKHETLKLRPKAELIGIETPIATYAIFKAMAIRVEMEAEKQARRIKRRRFWRKLQFWRKEEA